MNDLRGKWALVTGASSGFGVEFARLLAARKANLILTARRTDRMEALAKQLQQRDQIDVVVERIDLSDAGAAAELKRRLDERGIAVDILVNNAGYGLYGPFTGQPLEKILNMLQLDVVALTELTHVFAADMVKRKSGHILLVASLLGFQAVPGYAAYAASKGYVLLLGEALHSELKPYGVNVTVLSPGATATSFGEVASQRDTFGIRMLMMQPAPVAAAGVRAMLREEASMVAGLMNKLVVFSNRFTPRFVQRIIMQRVLSG